jgi:hypothetical protein
MADDLNVAEYLSPAREPLVGSLGHNILVTHRNEVERDGFSVISSDEMTALVNNADKLPLLAAAANMPLDPFADGQRRRCYRTGVMLPWAGEFRFDPPFKGRDGAYVPYWQSALTNHDANGRERRFAPVPDGLETDPLLLRLIWASFRLIPGGYITNDLPVRVGIHIIRLSSDGRRVCTSSPNHLHTDGEPWTSIILLDRVNIADHSALSFVAERRCAGLQPVDVAREELLAKVTMVSSLEAIMVDDSRVSHCVTGALGADGTSGHRTSLLIDFSGIRLDRTVEPRRA